MGSSSVYPVCLFDLQSFTMAPPGGTLQGCTVTILVARLDAFRVQR